MGLETGTYISDLVSTNPVSSDPKSQGDDHIRFVKATVKATFPNVTGAVTATHTELNYVDGVTSDIQTQFSAKADLASPVLTGVPEATTAAFGASGTQIATLDFVNAVATNAALPAQTGNADKILTSDGTTATWNATINTSVVTPAVGTAFATTTGAQTLEDKSLETPIFIDSSDATKKANIVLSGVTAGQNRSMTVADENMTLFTPGWRLLATVTASNSATVDVEYAFSTTYDTYMIVASGITAQTNNVKLKCRIKSDASYLSAATSYDTRAFYEGTYTITDQDHIVMTDVGLGNGAEDNCNFIMYINNPASTAFSKILRFELDFTQTGAGGSPISVRGVANHDTDVAALTGIRFFLTSDNIVAGDFRLYGLRKT